ncbi:MAG: rhomboid family intramembrane serine protease [Verrucomicrobia bacterium]|nr:rhomboid family intramembrane serine protease [Verrucomicrobiota bacterium]
MIWACQDCGGRAISLGLLRREVQAGPINQIWRKARDEQGSAGRLCPSCMKPMLVVQVLPSGSRFDVDVCKRCQFLWFDKGEFDAMPALPPRPQTLEESLPQKARELVAEVEVRRIRERAQEESFGEEGPDDWWQTVAGFLGLPVELDNPARYTPWLTWSVGAIMVLVTAFSYPHLGEIVDRYGMMASQPWRHGGLTWLTSFFLHGGVLHLFSNLYFLFVFGDNAEETLGWRRFLLLLVAACVAGHALHIALEPRTEWPAVGASGGISGVITFYALQFPRTRLGFCLRWGWRYQWMSMSVVWALAIWVLLQVVGAAEQVAGFSNVSSLAHLGGAVIGLLFWLRLRLNRPREN